MATQYKTEQPFENQTCWFFQTENIVHVYLCENIIYCDFECAIHQLEDFQCLLFNIQIKFALFLFELFYITMWQTPPLTPTLSLLIYRICHFSAKVKFHKNTNNQMAATH